jgi:hypothetical protein
LWHEPVIREEIQMLVFLSLLAAAAQAPAATPPAADKDPIICTSSGQSEVGTHMRPKKVCMRKSDWDYVEKNTRTQLQSINQRGNNPGNHSEDRGGPN